MKAPVGSRVRRVRRIQGLTQKQLAALAHVDHMTISRLEHGTSKVIYPDTLVSLARALDVTSDYLLGLSEETGGREGSVVG